MSRFNSLELENTPVQAMPLKKTPEQYGEKARDADYYLAEAEKELLQFNPGAALELYSKALEVDPGSPDAWCGQIDCLIRLQEYREARMWSKKAVEMVGENQHLLALQSLLHCRTGDFDRAYGLSDASIEADGNLPLVWVVRGEIMLHAGKDAEFCFKKAISAAPENWQTKLDIASVCMFNAKNTMALKYLQIAQDNNPGVPAIWYLTGTCLHAMGKKKKCLEAYSRVIELNPAFPGVRETYNSIKNEGFLKSLMRRIWG